MSQCKGFGVKVVDGAREPEGRLSELYSLKELAGNSNRNSLKAEENLKVTSSAHFSWNHNEEMEENWTWDTVSNMATERKEKRSQHHRNYMMSAHTGSAALTATILPSSESQEEPDKILCGVQIIPPTLCSSQLWSGFPSSVSLFPADKSVLWSPLHFNSSPQMLPLHSPPQGHVLPSLHVWSEHPLAAPRPGPGETGVPPPSTCSRVREDAQNSKNSQV